MSHANACLAALLAAAATLLAGPANAGGSDPQIVLDEIYGQVAEMCSGDGQGPAYDLTAIANAYFVPSLAAKLAKSPDEGGLGFDVLVDAQDCQVTALDLRVVSQAENAAVGRAEFQNFGESRTIDLVMTRSGGDWKVADIVYRHRPFSLEPGE